MSFENPLFLWALALLLIPILIHLFHFRRYRKVLFTNVKWLKDIKQDSTSSRTIRKWLILACRLGVLTCLILAFAIPHLHNEEPRQFDGQVIIYLDNSLSMEREGKNGPLIEEARNQAIAAIRSYPPGTRFGVMNNEGRLRFYSNKQAIEQVMETEITNLQISPETLKRKLEEDGTKSTGYVFSDFQVSVFTAGMDSLPNVKLVCVPSFPNNQQNISIDSAWFEKPVITKGNLSRLRVQISNRGPSSAEGMSVQFKMGGALMGTQTVNLNEGETGVISFDFIPSTSGWLEASIEVSDYPMQFDDRYFIAFESKESYDVLLLTNDQNTPVSRLFNGNAMFHLDVGRTDRVDFASLPRYQLIIIDQLTEYPIGLANELKKTGESGTALTMFAPDQSAIDQYNAFIGRLGGYPVQSSVAAKVKCANLWYDHPLYRGVFTSKQQNLNLPEVSHYSRIRFPGKPIVELEDGSPFLLESPLGSGYLYQLAVGDNPEQSNFGQHALFVPTLHNMVFRHQDVGLLSLTIGTDEVVNLKQDISSNDLPVLTIGNGEEMVYPELTFGYPRRLSARSAIQYPGVYNLKIPQTDTLIRKVAFNLNRDESDPSVMTTEEISDVFQGSEVLSPNNPKTLQNQLVQDRSGIPLWKWLVLGALLFVVIEIFLLRLLQG